jgi:polar amino acid transport system substrate-binding protein
MTEDLKPYNYEENGQLKGFSVEVVEHILTSLHYDEKIRIYPWSRAVSLLESKDNAVLFSMSHTSQRAKKYKFACPLTEVKTVFFANKQTKFQSLEDLHALRVGVIKDFAAHKMLVEKGFDTFDFSSSTSVMVQKLNEDKIDVFVATPESVYGLGLDMSTIKQTDVTLYKTQLCIAFNKNISDKEVAAWQDALNDFRTSKQFALTYEKYFGSAQ